MFRILKEIAFRRFKAYETRLHELNYLFWECTTRCNLNCLHCGSDCARDSLHDDMPSGDFFRALDTIPHPAKGFTVVITGGEPLLRNDLEACGREIRRRGMRWAIVSNGQMYSKERHNSLLNAGMGALTISIDGLEDTHNWLRNSGNSFRIIPTEPLHREISTRTISLMYGKTVSSPSETAAGRRPEHAPNAINTKIARVMDCTTGMTNEIRYWFAIMQKSAKLKKSIIVYDFVMANF